MTRNGTVPVERFSECAKCRVAALCLVCGTPAFQFGFYKCTDCGAFLLGRTHIFYSDLNYEQVTMANTVEYRKAIDAESGRHVRIGAYGLRRVTLPSCIDMERFDPLNSNRWFVRAAMCPICQVKGRSAAQRMLDALKLDLEYWQRTMFDALGIPKEYLEGYDVDAPY